MIGHPARGASPGGRRAVPPHCIGRPARAVPYPPGVMPGMRPEASGSVRRVSGALYPILGKKDNGKALRCALSKW